MSTTIDGSASVTINSGAVLGITSGTAVASTSGTSIDFTGIPSWVKRVTVMFSGVSTNGTSDIQFRLGTSGGVEATGYLGDTSYFAGGSVNGANISTGFGLGTTGATSLKNGSVVFSNLSSNTWTCNGLIAESGAAILSVLAGSKILSGTLDRVRITTANGTDTFDAGSINIMYEG